MSERKPTPDILGGLLAGGSAPDSSKEAELRSAPDIQMKADKERPSSNSRSKSGEQKRTSKRSAAASGGILEQRVASFQEHRGWRLRYENGLEVRDWATGRTMLDYIAEMNAAGWEITAATSGRAMFGALDQYQIFFKRRL